MVKRCQMVGSKHGRLTVMKMQGAPVSGRHPKWVCKCDCGAECVRSTVAITSGREPSCGCATREFQRGKHDISGIRFGRLVALRPHQSSDRKRQITWECVCDCGNKTTVTGSQLRSGKTQSCGCLHVELLKNNTTHGHTSGKISPTYHSWASMLTRCTNPNAENYRHYGGRGISVCDRWVSFENFLADMGERPDGKTIDRINNDGDYEPSNCRWATQSEQVKNQRKRL